MGTGLEYVAMAVVAAASYQQQHKQQKRAEAKQKEAQEKNDKATAAQQSMEQAKDDQARRQQIREERRKRAMILQSSENNGTGYASGEIGGQGALSTDYYANMQLINGTANNRMAAESYQAQANDAWFKATQAQNRARQISAVGGLANTMIGMGAQFYEDFSNGGYEKLFGGTKSATQHSNDFKFDPGARNPWKNKGVNTKKIWQ